jgi:hypothetical protein
MLRSNQRFYCEARCRQLNYIDRRKGKTDAVLVPLEMRGFAVTIRRWAPAHAAGYTLDLPVNGITYRYPPVGRTLRYDRMYSNLPWFDLHSGGERAVVP